MNDASSAEFTQPKPQEPVKGPKKAPRMFAAFVYGAIATGAVDLASLNPNPAAIVIEGESPSQQFAKAGFEIHAPSASAQNQQENSGVVFNPDPEHSEAVFKDNRGAIRYYATWDVEGDDRSVPLGAVFNLGIVGPDDKQQSVVIVKNQPGSRELNFSQMTIGSVKIGGLDRNIGRDEDAIWVGITDKNGAIIDLAFINREDFASLDREIPTLKGFGRKPESYTGAPHPNNLKGSLKEVPANHVFTQDYIVNRPDVPVTGKLTLKLGDSGLYGHWKISGDMTPYAQIFTLNYYSGPNKNIPVYLMYWRDPQTNQPDFSQAFFATIETAGYAKNGILPNDDTVLIQIKTLNADGTQGPIVGHGWVKRNRIPPEEWKKLIEIKPDEGNSKAPEPENTTDNPVTTQQTDPTEKPEVISSASITSPTEDSKATNVPISPSDTAQANQQPTEGQPDNAENSHYPVNPQTGETFNYGYNSGGAIANIGEPMASGNMLLSVQVLPDDKLRNIWQIKDNPQLFEVITDMQGNYISERYFDKQELEQQKEQNTQQNIEPDNVSPITPSSNYIIPKNTQVLNADGSNAGFFTDDLEVEIPPEEVKIKQSGFGPFKWGGETVWKLKLKTGAEVFIKDPSVLQKPTQLQDQADTSVRQFPETTESRPTETPAHTISEEPLTSQSSDVQNLSESLETLNLPVGEIVSRGPQNGRAEMAITFDDNYSTSDIEQVLTIAEQYNAKITFFPLGSIISGHGDLWQRVVAAGHEIGIHSMNHDRYTSMSADQIRADIDNCITAIRAAVGDPNYQVNWLRPPYGDGGYQSAPSVVLQQVAGEKGVVIVMWSQDPDFSGDQFSVSPGVISLHHGNGGKDVRLLAERLQQLQAAGLSAVTMTQLFDYLTTNTAEDAQTYNSPVQPEQYTNAEKIPVNIAPTITAEQIRAELAKFNSPFTDQADFIYSEAVRQGIDPAFALAIFYIDNHYAAEGVTREEDGSESIARTNFNPGGLKPGRGGATQEERGHAKFSSYKEGLTAFFRHVRERYLDQGKTTLEDIMNEYAPPDDPRNNTPQIINTMSAKMRELQASEGQVSAQNSPNENLYTDETTKTLSQIPGFSDKRAAVSDLREGLVHGSITPKHIIVHTSETERESGAQDGVSLTQIMYNVGIANNDGPYAYHIIIGTQEDPYLLGPDGKYYAPSQLVFGTEDYIWHTGSAAHPRTGEIHSYNSDSIGIVIRHGEFEKPTQAEINTLIATLARLCLQYQIPLENIFGHAEADTVQRENEPIGINMDDLRRQVQAEIQRIESS